MAIAAIFTPFPLNQSIRTPGKYDCSCDIWSCGVIMYTMLCCLVLWKLPERQGPLDMGDHGRNICIIISCVVSLWMGRTLRLGSTHTHDIRKGTHVAL